MTIPFHGWRRPALCSSASSNEHHILRSDLSGADDKFIDGPPFTWNRQRRKDFDTALAGAEKLAQDRLKQTKDDPRALFALTLVTGLRADDAALIAKKKFSAL